MGRAPTGGLLRHLAAARRRSPARPASPRRAADEGREAAPPPGCGGPGRGRGGGEAWRRASLPLPLPRLKRAPAAGAAPAKVSGRGSRASAARAPRGRGEPRQDAGWKACRAAPCRAVPCRRLGCRCSHRGIAWDGRGVQPLGFQRPRGEGTGGGAPLAAPSLRAAPPPVTTPCVRVTPVSQPAAAAGSEMSELCLQPRGPD